MTNRIYIPNDKDDQVAVDNLKGLDWTEIEPHIDELLVWLQDMNWPVARGVGDKLSAYTNKLKAGILAVLRGSDGLWKYCCILTLIYYSKERSIDAELLKELQRLVQFPSTNDVAEEVNEIAQETLDKWS